MTFSEWIEKEYPLIARCGGRPKGGVFRDARDAMEIGWNAALEAAARAQCPMLRDMISRGKAADICRSLKSEGP